MAEFDDNHKKSITPGIGVEGCKLPSPSKVNTMPLPVQAFVFFAISAAISCGTMLLSAVLEAATVQYNWIQSWRYSWPLMIGALYAAAGIPHFVNKENLGNIYPPRGTWGFWYLPGTSTFHVFWTGIVEIACGLGLLLGGIMELVVSFRDDDHRQSSRIVSAAGSLRSVCAAILFMLTVAVTPANIFMYTHGARMPLSTPSYSLRFHIFRGLIQILLLSLLYEMGSTTLNALTIAAKTGAGSN
jgi:uncharacterized membrane protein